MLNDIGIVTRFKSWLAVTLLAVGLALPVGGQSQPEWQARNYAEKPPESGILDASHLLDHHSDSFQRISSEIRKLRADRGFSIYLVLEPVLIGTSVQELANELRRSWLPDGTGVVLVFETDSRMLGVGQEMIEKPEQKETAGHVPNFESTAILTQSMAAVDKNLPTEAYLDAFVGKLAEGFNNYFDRLETPPPKQRSIRTALLVVGGLSLLGLAAIAAGALIRYTSMAKVGTYRFPVVDRPERLGAPGGASVTCRRFATAQQKS